jgi:hypothetical protein
MLFITYDIFTKSIKMTEIILRPDSKSKLNIGEIAQGVSSYRDQLEKMEY